MSTPKLLSRIAESLYWIGRYVERADDTARILDAHVHDFVPSAEDADAACRTLLDVMGRPQPAGELDVSWLTYLLTVDETNSSSIVSCFAAARENARGARECISAEMWGCLNATWYELPQYLDAVGRDGPHRLFRFIKERASLFIGLSDTTMSRDDAWRFVTLGRSIERIDMTTRLLCSRVGQSEPANEWVTVLNSCSAFESFVRSQREEVTPDRVLEFLLLDRLFPRSIHHAISLAERCLSELDRSSRDLDEARRVLGQARTRLEYEPLPELLTNVGPRLLSLQDACSGASAAIARRWFRSAPAVEWAAGA